jgi:hypothetical protein
MPDPESNAPDGVDKYDTQPEIKKRLYFHDNQILGNKLKNVL